MKEIPVGTLPGTLKAREQMQSFGKLNLRRWFKEFGEKYECTPAQTYFGTLVENVRDSDKYKEFNERDLPS